MTTLWKLWNGYGPLKSGLYAVARIGPDDAPSGLVGAEGYDIVGRKDVLEYINKFKISRRRQSLWRRTANLKSQIRQQKDVSGVFSGHYATHPKTSEKLPIWIADYVMMDYGSGAVMGVPAHDKRDLQFAGKYNLPIKCDIGNQSLI